MRCRITQFARASVGLCPFPGLSVREFELSHSNLASRIIKITHAHNLHVKVLDFGLLQFVRKKNVNCLLENLKKITSASFHYLQLNYASCNVKVDSLAFIVISCYYTQ